MDALGINDISFTDSEKSFLLYFSVLELDLQYFLKTKTRDRAMSRIKSFSLKRNVYAGVSSPILRNALVGLTDDLSASGLLLNSNAMDFVVRQKSIDTQLIASDSMEADEFIVMIETIFNSFYELIAPLDKELDLRTVSKQVRLVMYYIDLHKNHSLKVDTILKEMGLDPGYTTRLFKKETGISVTTYITKSKMTEAKRLLLKTDLSIKAIAKDLAYYDTPSFTKQFQKSFDIPPSLYREFNKIVGPEEF